MNTIFIRAIALVCLFSGAAASADTYADLESTFKTIEDVFHSRYGLADYKKTLFGWDVDQQIQTLLTEAKQNPNLTLHDAQLSVNQLFTSARDYHAQVILSGQPYLEVPIGVHSASNRVFVTFIKTPTQTGAIQIGDEILTYDGVAVSKVIKSLMPKPINVARSDLRDVERRLTARYGMLADPVPTSTTLVLTLKHADGKVYTQNLNWTNGATATTTTTKRVVMAAKAAPQMGHRPAILQGNLMSDPYGYTSVKGFLPKPAHVTWEAPATDFFYSWIGTTAEGKRIGMIRVPTFSYGSAADFGKAVDAFKALIIRMNAETDALILDTQGNRGGLADYAHVLVSFFIQAPVKTDTYAYRLSPDLVQSMRADLVDLAAIQTQADVEAYFGANQYGGYPVDLDFVKDVLRFEQDTVADADAGLTMGKARYYNIEYIKPYPGVQPYLKPVFVATDEWTLSCGDTFAGYMQDYGLGTIVGVQTAGAGAFVGSGVTITNSLKISNIRVPIALEYRTDGSTIENFGVTPDIEIAPDATDLKTGTYPHYQKALYRQIQDYL